MLEGVVVWLLVLGAPGWLVGLIGVFGFAALLAADVVGERGIGDDV